MKTLFRQVPLPICGLILGIASLGNLFKALGLNVVANGFGIISSVLMLLVLCKIVTDFKHTIMDIKDPIIASVAPTFTMALMIIATFIKAWGAPSLAAVIWVAAVILQFVIIGAFFYFHMLVPSVGLENVYPSWFVTFVGIGVIPVTAPNFIVQLGTPVLWLSLLLYAVLLPIVCVRLLRRELPFEATLPLLTIMAAPASLCLTGYLSMTSHPSWGFSLFMLILAQTLYWGTLAKIVKYVRLSFYPSFAAFTFPLVISATALNLFNKTFVLTNNLNQILNGLVYVELVIATSMVLFVLVRYVAFLAKKFQVQLSELKNETL
ncbi:C4-dicarboxylate ABC transporter [Lentilactobacillus curieae]|uniref:C4-dicarboxylate ABC transporter n=1 Tax=Lentilactobacillus curieae TaxID=1138822 RepID=A0A1S6QHP6_9LACO|nr:TDT family transporter [Lentilactobacillus curieae]AQW21134.1 C4-dicarboxylate ABC transporter [Lentilactobacillus curieae]